MEFHVRDFILHLKWTLSFIFNCKLKGICYFFWNISLIIIIVLFVCIFISQNKLVYKTKNKGPKKSDYFVIGILLFFKHLSVSVLDNLHVKCSYIKENNQVLIWCQRSESLSMSLCPFPSSKSSCSAYSLSLWVF